MAVDTAMRLFRRTVLGNATLALEKDLRAPMAKMASLQQEPQTNTNRTTTKTVQQRKRPNKKHTRNNGNHAGKKTILQVRQPLWRKSVKLLGLRPRNIRARAVFEDDAAQGDASLRAIYRAI